jgi:hypothetical protein
MQTLVGYFSRKSSANVNYINDKNYKLGRKMKNRREWTFWREGKRSDEKQRFNVVEDFIGFDDRRSLSDDG